MVNERLPFVATLENPCNAQMVAFDGEFHTTFSVTESGGGGFYLQSSFNTSGVTGTGIVDMKRYRMTETATSSLHTGSDGLPFTQKETFKFHIMGPARADDFYLHTTFKITINNNGIPTAFVDNFHTSCK